LYATFLKWATDELCLSFFFAEWTARSMHISVTLAVLLHMAGVFHVAALSIVRYFTLKKLISGDNHIPWFSFRVCKWMILVIFISVFLAAFPLAAMCTVAKKDRHEDCVEKFPDLANVPSYELQMTEDEVLVTFNFWMFHLCDKLIPSLFLCVMTWLIVRKFNQV
ncbi:hypothetical protein PMAYCL1PPCAC_03945, partial [Pristionchus mayeri]